MILLASKSPRRAELLTQIGVDFELVEAQINEQARTTESPNDYTLRMALEKATKGWQSSQLQGQGCSKPVLGADTCVVIDQAILGKPNNKADAMQMLELLSGRQHRVLTAVALLTANDSSSVLVETEVCFKVLSEQEMDWYWHTREPLDKAGSYAIQGIGGQFVQQIKGSYSAVVGLPLYETVELLTTAGLKLHER